MTCQCDHRHCRDSEPGCTAVRRAIGVVWAQMTDRFRLAAERNRLYQSRHNMLIFSKESPTIRRQENVGPGKTYTRCCQRPSTVEETQGWKIPRFPKPSQTGAVPDGPAHVHRPPGIIFEKL